MEGTHQPCRKPTGCLCNFTRLLTCKNLLKTMGDPLERQYFDTWSKLLKTHHMCTAMTSILSNDLAQFGHFRMRFEMRSSTQLLQKRWPQVFNTVFLKSFRQIVQRARVYRRLCQSYIPKVIHDWLTRSISSSPDWLLKLFVFQVSLSF